MPAIMRAVYMWVALGLLIAFGIAYAIGSPVAAQLDGTQKSLRALNSPLFNPVVVIVTMIAYLGVAFTLQPVIMRARPAIGTVMYLIFTALFGFMMSTIFITYTVSQISTAFIATAATFGAMSVIGYTTKIDLSRMGSMLMMALIGMIIASIVNIFLASSTLMWIINYAGVLIFVGLTAYDTQWIKNTAMQVASSGDPDAVQRVALIGAFHLFLDFANLFMFILRIIGAGGRGGRR
jgi:FtsH-binding integral membrane protein